MSSLGHVRGSLLTNPTMRYDDAFDDYEEPTPEELAEKVRRGSLFFYLAGATLAIGILFIEFDKYFK
jgi:hypothetical protein